MEKKNEWKGIWVGEDETYVKRTLRKWGGEEEVELSLVRIRRTTSSGNCWKGSWYLLLLHGSFNGLLMFLHLRDIDSVMLCVVYVLDGIEMVEIVLILMSVCVCEKWNWKKLKWNCKEMKRRRQVRWETFDVIYIFVFRHRHGKNLWTHVSQASVLSYSFLSYYYF
jgi:hypothetical protein